MSTSVILSLGTKAGSSDLFVFTSDGSAAAPQEVADLGAFSGLPRVLGTYDSRKVIALASPSGTGFNLWLTDGTSAGTYRLFTSSQSIDTL